MDARQLVEKVIVSESWVLADDWGVPRKGHPEGTIGRHVREQLLPFIDLWYRELPDYWDLVALSYLHDIGKPETRYEGGRLVGEPHSIVSARIASEIGASKRIVDVILRNDRAYGHWRSLIDNKGEWTATRWTPERQDRFIQEFGDPELDLDLLVRFHRADNAHRRPAVMTEATDPVMWFENQLLDLKLLNELPPDGRDQRLEWSDLPLRLR